MTIDIMVGLPHLGDGAIINRPVDMRVPTLISANALSRWNHRKGWAEWRARTPACSPTRRLASPSLDSAVRRHGAPWRVPWATSDYLALAASYPFRWFASMDYCIEPVRKLPRQLAGSHMKCPCDDTD